MRLAFVALLGLDLFAVYALNTLLSILIPLVQRDYVLSPITIGLIISSYGWAVTLMQFPVGIISDRVEPKLLLSGSMGALFLSSLYFAFSNGANDLIISRVLMGLAASFVFVVGIKALDVYYGEKDTGKALGIFGSFANLGVLGSNSLASIVITLTGAGWRPVFAYASTIALIAAAISLFFIPSLKNRFSSARAGRLTAQDEEGTSSLSTREHLGAIISKKGFWVQNFISLTFFGSLFGLLFWIPIFLKEIGFSLIFAGAVISLLGLGSMIGNIFVGWLIDRTGKMNSIMRVCLLCYALLILPLVFPQDTALYEVTLLITCFLLGFSWGGVTANTRIVTAMFHGRVVGTAFGITNSLRWLGSSVYPFMVGVLVTLGIQYNLSFLVLDLTIFFTLVVSLLSKEIYNGARPIIE